MNGMFCRKLRLALAFWFSALAVAPAVSPGISWADTPTPEQPAPEDPVFGGEDAGEPQLANDARAITEPTEIKKILDNLTIYGRYSNGENWIEYHLADGRTAYWEKGCTYPGKWWLQSGQVCYAYPSYHNGASNCFIMYQRPSGEIQFIAIADAGYTYLASFSLKTATGNDAGLPIGAFSPCVGA